MKRNPKKSFTLIELLLVIAIISILASLLAPALKNARAEAKRIVCMNNLKQIYLTTLSYAHDNDGYPPQTWDGNQRWHQGLSNYVACAYLPASSLRYPANIYYCPSNPSWYPEDTPSGWSNYGWNFYFGWTGAQTWYSGLTTLIRLEAVPKPATTVLVGDLHQQTSGYFPYTILDDDGSSTGINYHLGNGNFMMADGHVEVLSPTALNNNRLMYLRGQ